MCETPEVLAHMSLYLQSDLRRGLEVEPTCEGLAQLGPIGDLRGCLRRDPRWSYGGQGQLWRVPEGYVHTLSLRNFSEGCEPLGLFMGSNARIFGIT